MFPGAPLLFGLLLAGSECAATPYDCAVQHVTREEFAPAIALLEKEHVRKPGDLRVLNLLGIALTGAGRLPEANARFRAALARDPTFSPAARNLGVNEFNRDRLIEAQRRFEAVIASAPSDDVAHFYLGEIHHRRQRLAQALTHYEKSLARVLKNPRALLRYAEALLAATRRDEAVQVLAMLPVDDADHRFQAGVLLARSKAHAEAARFFASARRGYRDPGAAGYNQVLMLVEAGQHADALAVVRELGAERPPTGELLNLASRAFLGAGRLKEAYDALRQAAALEPNVEQHYLDLAAICLEHQNYDLGLEIVDVGLRQLPSSLKLRLQRGVLLAEKGMLGEAEKEFEAARVLAPDHAVPYVGLAMAWMQTGQGARAVEVLRPQAKAMKREPLLAFMLGVALSRSGAEPQSPAATEAQAAFASALRADPRFAPARAELGKLLLGQGHVEGGIVELQKAVELDPDEPGPLYLLARAYQRKGDTVRAQETMQRVSALRSGGAEGDADADLRRVVFRIFKEGSR